MIGMGGGSMYDAFEYYITEFKYNTKQRTDYYIACPYLNNIVSY